MVKTPNKRKMAIICTTMTYDDKKELILFQIYLIYAENEALKTFIQVVHVLHIFPQLFPLLVKALLILCVSLRVYTFYKIS